LLTERARQVADEQSASAAQALRSSSFADAALAAGLGLDEDAAPSTPKGAAKAPAKDAGKPAAVAKAGLASKADAAGAGKVKEGAALSHSTLTRKAGEPAREHDRRDVPDGRSRLRGSAAAAQVPGLVIRPAPDQPEGPIVVRRRDAVGGQPAFVRAVAGQHSWDESLPSLLAEVDESEAKAKALRLRIVEVSVAGSGIVLMEAQLRW
jgi:hypothetical protein